MRGGASRLPAWRFDLGFRFGGAADRVAPRKPENDLEAP